MIPELESVVLVGDLPEYGLRDGDIGTVVHSHPGDAGYEVEFVTLDGETFAVVSAFPHQVRPLGRREIAQARALEVA